MDKKIIESTGWYRKVRRAVDDALVEAYQQGHREGWNERGEADETMGEKWRSDFACAGIRSLDIEDEE